MQFGNIQLATKRGVVLVVALCMTSAALTACSSGRKKRGSTDEATGSQIGGTLSARDEQSSGVQVLDRYMKEQEVALAGIEGSAVDRFAGEIKVTWSNAALFDFDSAMLKQSSRPEISKMAEVFVKYPDTYILITGHTDAEGEDSYNQKLSERRAISVRNYLETMGVASSRLETIGYGSLRPIAANDTEEGRQQNQRIEIIVRPNEDLRRRAVGGE